MINSSRIPAPAQRAARHDSARRCAYTPIAVPARRKWPMINLFWCPRTRASRILWLLEELGQPFQVTTIDIRDPQAREDPAFRAASPMGKVPALADGKVMLADSAAIAIYLADRYPQAGLAPAIDDDQRGRYLYWMTFTPGVIEPAMAEKFNGWEVSPATSGWGNFDRMIETLCGGLEAGPWLLGKHFSAADVLVGSSVYFMRLFGILPEEQRLADYADRCLARPAYARALERDAEPG
jgi:glutathione S-transferase